MNPSASTLLRSPVEAQEDYGTMRFKVGPGGQMWLRAKGEGREDLGSVSDYRQTASWPPNSDPATIFRGMPIEGFLGWVGGQEGTQDPSCRKSRDEEGPHHVSVF